MYLYQYFDWYNNLIFAYSSCQFLGSFHWSTAVLCCILGLPVDVYRFMEWLEEIWYWCEDNRLHGLDICGWVIFIVTNMRIKQVTRFAYLNDWVFLYFYQHDNRSHGLDILMAGFSVLLRTWWQVTRFDYHAAWVLYAITQDNKSQALLS